MKIVVSGSPTAQHVGTEDKRTACVLIRCFQSFQKGFIEEPASQHSTDGKHNPPRPQLCHYKEKPQPQ